MKELIYIHSWIFLNLRITNSIVKQNREAYLRHRMSNKPAIATEYYCACDMNNPMGLADFVAIRHVCEVPMPLQWLIYPLLALPKASHSLR